MWSSKNEASNQLAVGSRQKKEVRNQRSEIRGETTDDRRQELHERIRKLEN